MIKIKPRMYALLTIDRTAMAETALCSACYPEPGARAAAEQAARASGEAMSAIPSEDGSKLDYLWEDCTDNEVLECRECGGHHA